MGEPRMTRTILTPAQAAATAAFFLAERKRRHGDAFRMDATGGDTSGADSGSDDGAGDSGSDDSGSDDEPNETPEAKAARLEAELAEAKKNSRKWEDRAKASKPKADELDRLKAEGMKPDEKLAAAEKAAAEARAELARYRVAAETGLPAELIVGDDEDAMKAYAEKLKAFAGDKAPQTKSPKPDPSQGNRTGPKPSAADAGRAEAQKRFGTK